MRIVDEGIEEFVRSVTLPHLEVFEELEAETRCCVRHPQMLTGRVEGQLLRLLTLLVRPRVAVEIGTYTGYSAMCIASALPEDGTLYTFDRDEETAAIARRYFARVPFGHRIVPVMGDARDRVHDLQWPVDMAFIDANKRAYDHYYEHLLERLRPGGLMVIDNTLWKGEVLAPRTEDAKAIYELDHKIARDPRVESVILTVRDGITLVRKRDEGRTPQSS